MRKDAIKFSCRNSHRRSWVNREKARSRVRERQETPLIYLLYREFKFRVHDRLAMRRRVHRIRSCLVRAAAAAAYASAQKPARLDSRSPRHHENIRPSLSLFLLRPCGLRGLKQYRALRAGEVVRVHAARSYVRTLYPRSVQPPGGHREVKAAPFRRDFACRAKCAAKKRL